MRIIESFTSAKSGNEDNNEDMIVVNGHYAAVIDGATRDRTMRIEGATPGRLIAQCIGRNLGAFEAGLAGAELIDRINGRVREELWPLAEGLEPSVVFNASVIIYTADTRMVTSVGDCLCRIGDDIHAGTKKIDLLLAEMRSIYNRLMALSQTGQPGADPGRDLIIPVLKLQPLLANSDNCPGYNYGVINGTAVPPQFVSTWQVGEGQQVVLASDGYLSPELTLDAAESRLRNRLESDPGMDRIAPYATKGTDPRHPNRSFDDRSYLRLVSN